MEKVEHLYLSLTHSISLFHLKKILFLFSHSQFKLEQSVSFILGDIALFPVDNILFSIKFKVALKTPTQIYKYNLDMEIFESKFETIFPLII